MSSTVSWEKYIESNISEFRKNYEKWSTEEKRLIEKNKKSFISTLNKPCQILVLEFSRQPLKILVIMHNEKRADMETKVLQGQALADLVQLLEKSEFSSTEIGLLTAFVERQLDSLTRMTSPPMWRWSKYEQFVLLLAVRDPRTDASSNSLFDPLSEHMEYLAKEEVEKERAKELVKEIIGDIKKDAAEIPQKELRTKIVQGTEKLEARIEELDKKLEEKVGGVRQLIGASEKYLDWKAFTAEFDFLKTTHISKEVFEAQIKRLDEKIDTKVNALNTRLEDMKAIKFWSKRTLLEIILAIWGAIITLIAAGIIKIPF